MKELDSRSTLSRGVKVSQIVMAEYGSISFLQKNIDFSYFFPAQTLRPPPPDDRRGDLERFRPSGEIYMQSRQLTLQILVEP